MTNEQKVRVDRLERYLITDREKTYTTVRVNDLDTVLSLIKENQKEIEGLKNINRNQSKDIKKAVDYTFELNKELDKKDKQIDLMARAFKQDDVRTVEELKQYFAGLVEKE